MEQIKTARRRGIETTKELIGKNLKCKRCQSTDAYVCVEDGRYFVRCPDCQDHSYLKEYNLK